MRVIQITPAYKPAYIYGGPTMSVAKLCEALVGSETLDKEILTDDQDETNNNQQTTIKVEVEVFTTTANGQDELNVEVGKKVNVDGVPVNYFKRLTKDHTHFSPTLLWALYKEIKEQRARSKVLNPQHITHNSQHITHNTQLIIHIHSWWNLVAMLSCLIAKIYSVPVILSPRGMLTHYTQNNRNSFFKSALHVLMGKSLLKYCHILASTDQEKLDVLQIVKPKSISILPNLVNLPFTNWEPEIDFLPVNEKRKTKNEKSTTHIPFNLLFLSRINEIKGLDILLEALALVEIKWQLTIAGKGEEIYVDSLKEKAKSLKINNNIKWIGQVNNEDKFELMAQHDLLILTSYRESFANVIIESLSMGTPVLVSNEVGLSRYVIEKRLGYVTTLKTNHIANEIKTAYLEKDNRQRIRVDGPRIIYNDFNTDILIQHYLKLYKEIT